MALIIILSLLAALFLGLAISFILTGFSIAPWVPCRNKDLKRINRLADLGPGQVFYELGCGDGRVCSYLARQNPEARVVGIELSVAMYLAAKFLNSLLGPKNSQIKFGNAFQADLSGADVVFTFGLIGSMNKRLRPKFEQELKKSARILSYVFKINDWPGRSKIDKPDQGSLPIYIYEL